MFTEPLNSKHLSFITAADQNEPLHCSGRERGAMKIGRMSGEIPRNGNVLATLLTPTGEEIMR